MGVETGKAAETGVGPDKGMGADPPPGRADAPRSSAQTARALRGGLPGAVEGAVADALHPRPPRAAVTIDRLRVSVPAGADAAAVSLAVAQAIRAELARRR